MEKREKILIVDDTPGNLSAARDATKNFPEYTFVFLSGASEALTRIMVGEFDRVITDLVFPFADGNTEVMRKRCFQYAGDILRIRNIRALNEWAFFGEDDQALCGAILVEECQDRRLPVVLVTSIHNHAASGCRIEGKYVLAPLIERCFISHEQMIADGHPKRYLAGPLLDKNQPETWKRAIRMVLSQTPEECRTAEEERDHEFQGRVDKLMPAAGGNRYYAQILAQSLTTLPRPDGCVCHTQWMELPGRDMKEVVRNPHCPLHGKSAKH